MSVLPKYARKETLDPELLLCPRQPGKLRISKQACALNYMEAQKAKRKTPFYGSGIVKGWGLEICQTCPEGHHYAEEISATALPKTHGNK